MFLHPVLHGAFIVICQNGILNYYNKTVTGGVSLNLDKNNTLGGQLTYQRENDRYNGESNNVMMQGENVYERLNSTLDSHSHYNQWQANM